MFRINVNGTANVVNACLEIQCVLIHISTDFVFDGRKGRPYSTEDQPNPINVYGKSKLESEGIVQKTHKRHFIIRTSWVFSEHGRNFVKTMLRLGKERREIQVVNDQIGSPTYSGDLAEVIVNLIKSESSKYGIYHFTNQGEISWFEFAKAIFKGSDQQIKIIPVASSEYVTSAKRPKYSVLDNRKIQNLLDISLIDYTLSLNKVIKKLE